MFKLQSTAETAAYASVASAALAENVRSVASLPGSFSKKLVRGKGYWYYQVPDLLGGQAQIYVGPQSPQIDALVERHRAGELLPSHLQKLSRLAIAAGCPALVPNHAKIIGRLAEAGFFRAGGILVGTHVYIAYQNLLGVRWVNAAQTLDLDFAHPGRNVSIALPASISVDTKSAIDSLEMGFVPVKSLTTYVKSNETDLQIDFLTSMHRDGDRPIRIESLNVEMQPLKFMEFSMESPIQMVLLSNQGPIVVNAPPPEKYAVHKLLVYGERPQAMRMKVGKDLTQAATLIAYLSEYDPQALRDAWVDLIQRGAGWKSRAMEGLGSLAKHFPGLDLSFAQQEIDREQRPAG